EPADRPADEVIGQKGAQRRPRQREVVVLPERRPPRQDDEQEADLDEEDDVEEASEQDVNPRPGLSSVGRSVARRPGSLAPPSRARGRRRARAPTLPIVPARLPARRARGARRRGW